MSDSSSTRAILRDVNGEYIGPLDEVQKARYDLLADQGKVIRSHKMKKGRMSIIFRLKTKAQRKVEPSKSPNSDCSLSENDSRGLAGLNDDPGTCLIERWIGWGLISPKRPWRKR
jgi:hypothetical protein